MLPTTQIRLVAAVALCAALPGGPIAAPASARHAGTRADPAVNWIFTGRVVGGGRFPAAGALVEFEAPLRPPAVTRTTADGQFRLEVDRLGVRELGACAVRATLAGEVGRCDDLSVTLPHGAGALPGTESVDLGTIQLFPATFLDVLVLDHESPVRGAEVEVARLPHPAGYPLSNATTDAAGRARLGDLSGADLLAGVIAIAWTPDRQRRGWGAHQGLSGTAIPTDTRPARTVVVRMIDAAIEGWVPDAVSESAERHSRAAAAQLWTTAEPEATPAAPRTWRIVGSDNEADGRAPADGTPLIIHGESRPPDAPSVVAAVREGAITLDPTDVPDARLLATAPDGRVAILDPPSPGRETSFRRLRVIEVEARWDDGRPARGVHLDGVDAFDARAEEMTFNTCTDANGLARFALPPKSWVRVAYRDRGNRVPAGFVRGDLPDERQHLVIPRAAAVTLSFVDGRGRALPRGLEILSDQIAAAVTEDPAHGTATVWTTPGSILATPTLQIRGFGIAARTIELPLLAAGRARAITLQVEPSVCVHVKLPPWRAAPRETPVETYDEQLHRWKKIASLQQPELLNATADTVVTTDLAAGRYRVAWQEGGFSSRSAPFEIPPGVAEHHLSLDLSQTVTVRGKVEGVPGFPIEQAIVIPDFEKVTTPPDALVAERDGIPVDASGRFECVLVGARSFALRLWHPALVPAENGGRTSVTGEFASAQLVLTLPPRVATFSLAYGLPDGASPLVRISAVPSTNAAATPREFRACLIHGAFRFAGFDPGTYQLTIDPPSASPGPSVPPDRSIFRLPSRQPLVIENVVLQDGETQLGTMTFSVGATLKVRFITSLDEPPPAVTITADAIDAPTYRRSLWTTGERVAELSGLRAGRFRVRVTHGDRALLADEVLSCDGEHDVGMTINLP